MKKITFSTALLLLLIQPAFSQQIRITGSDNSSVSNLTVEGIQANESTDVRYDFLWWFGDGAYAIIPRQDVPNPNTTHAYLTHSRSNTILGSNNSPVCRTTLITTENYGHSGNPDLIHLDITSGSYPQPEESISTNYLNGERIGVQKFRNAVPGDIFYLLVTYRIPKSSGGGINISFGDLNDEFEYIQNGDGLDNKSFLPHNEHYNGSFRWEVPLNNERAEERTILLPFSYTGERISGTIPVELIFSYSSDTGNVEHTTSTELIFAESHDPNSIDVNIKNVEDCNIGGRQLEYTVHFENIGDGPANYVKIEVQLEDAHDLSDFEITKLPKGFAMSHISEGEIQGYQDNENRRTTERRAHYQRNLQNNTLTFEFFPVYLVGKDDKMHRSVSQDSIKFKIRIKDGYVIGDDPIEAYADITFDENPAMRSDTVYTTCVKPKCSSETACCPKENTYLIWILVGIIVIIILQILMFWCLCRRRSQH